MSVKFVKEATKEREKSLIEFYYHRTQTMRV